MNPMLISVCREYIELYNDLVSGKLDHAVVKSTESGVLSLRTRLISLAADRDKVAATNDSYNYALAVIALSEGK